MTKRYYWCTRCETVLRVPGGFQGMRTGPDHCGAPTDFLTDKEAAEKMREARHKKTQKR